MTKLKAATTSRTTVKQLTLTTERVQEHSLKAQKKRIAEGSPFSEAINKYILYYDELQYYISLGVQEETLTRTSLIRELDYDLWITHKGMSNRQLMESGKPPFLNDDEDSQLELHHIGQKYEAPFIEITNLEHNKEGNTKLLHRLNSEATSWRKNPQLLKQFNMEREKYWKLRVSKIYKVEPASLKVHLAQDYSSTAEISKEISSTLEKLFTECSVEDLQYISNLANNYVLMKEVGASSLEDFILNIKQESDEFFSITCPKCGNNEYALYGSYHTSSERIQRYQCNTCGKVFSSKHQSLISGSNLSYIEWLKFIDCLYNGFSLEKTAELCNLSKNAAFDNRLKLFYALKLLDEKVVLTDNVVIDETYFPLSFKGNHSNQNDFVMPREAHRRGRENNVRGTSKNQVCAVCALDDNGNSIARIASLGSPTDIKLNRAINNAISAETVTCIFSDKEGAIRKYAESLGIPVKQAKLMKKNKKYPKNQRPTREVYEINRYLQKMNAYHSRLKRFLHNFGGTSSQMLTGYLYLFSWKERNRDKVPTEAYKELLSVLTEPNLYKSKDEIVSENHFPSVYEINKPTKKPSFQNQERADNIYSFYAKGHTLSETAKAFGITYQRVDQIIQKYRVLGLAYPTEHEKRKPDKLSTIQKKKLKYQHEIARDSAIYKAKQEWVGDLNEYYAAMMGQYGLSEQRIKNINSEMKMIQALQDEIFVYNDYEYHNYNEVYTKVAYLYYQYLAIELLSCEESFQKVAEDTGYSISAIRAMIYDDDFFIPGLHEKKKGTPLTETANRNRQLFVDLLRWPDELSAFYPSAAEKYGISERQVKEILTLCYKANFKHYEMTHD